MGSGGGRERERERERKHSRQMVQHTQRHRVVKVHDLFGQPGLVWLDIKVSGGKARGD